MAAISQKYGITNLSFTGGGGATVFKLDLSLAPVNLETKGNNPSSVEASVSCPADSTLAVTPSISGDRITLTFNHAFDGKEAFVNLVLHFDSK